MKAVGTPFRKVDGIGGAVPAVVRGRLAAGWAVGVALAALVTACGGGGAGPDVETGPAADADASAQETGRRSPAELEAIYRARADSARLRFTAADVHFMTGMIVHHGQALVMAAMVPERTASVQMRTLGARIDNSQRDEIATMQRWLRDRGQPVPEVEVDGTEMAVRWADGTNAATEDLPDLDEHALHMAGMLSPEQMRNLAEAQGAEFDRLFLTYMIQHHQGAVDMVHELFATDGAAQDEAVFRIASDIQVDQRTEIARMERMLGAMTTEGGGR